MGKASEQSFVSYNERWSIIGILRTLVKIVNILIILCMDHTRL